jgi:diguanylate cyclase (GGDEF)-like protein
MAFTPERLPIRILCIEDDDSHVELLRSYLERLPFAVEVVEAATIAEAKARFVATPFEAIVVDCQLPDGSGLDLVSQLAPGGTPLIVLSGVGSEKVAVEAMKRGAVDYLKKDGDLRTELGRSVLEALERRSRQASRTRATRELELLAFSDPLTGLRNRRFFDDIFERELATAIRYGHPLSLLVLDLDHFKRVNDTWGHPAGDRVLSSTSRLIREIVRTSDLVARLGGEEFAVLLPCTPHSGARILADRILAGVGALRHEAAGTQFVVTVSGGLATFAGGEVYESAERLFAAADQALYRAKAEGRNRIVVAPADPGSPGTSPRSSRIFDVPRI